MTRALRLMAVGVAALSVAALVANIVIGSAVLSWTDMAWPLPNIIVGLLLTYRRPRLLTGWIFALIGLLVTSGAVAEGVAVAGLPVGGEPRWWGILAAWYVEWYWLPLIYTMLIFLPLLFPTGRPPTPRWRGVTIGMFVVLAGAVVLASLQHQLDPVAAPPVINPIGIAGLGDVEDGAAGGVLALLTGLCLVATLTGLIRRYRRSTGVERQQLKWFTSAGVALIVGFVLQGLIDASGRTRLELLDVTLFALPPVAAAVAILRYRLYAIDRIISRTVTYALVTALLIGVYVGAVAAISAVIDPLAGESPLAVATATLAAAAAFRPARRRIQGLVDRRFNRARYDVERTLEGFREHVRSDVDLDRLCGSLVSVADQTLQPSAVAVWLQPERTAT